MFLVHLAIVTAVFCVLSEILYSKVQEPIVIRELTDKKERKNAFCLYVATLISFMHGSASGWSTGIYFLYFGYHPGHAMTSFEYWILTVSHLAL